MGLIGEFRDFIVKGNAIDLAVGIIIGAAFGAVVNSLVADVIMPPIGALMGGIDFSNLGVELVKAVPAGAEHPITGLTNETGKELAPVVLRYGKFINALIALLIQGFAIFMVVKGINKLRKPAPAAAPAGPPEDVLLLREIRDSLKR
jgi:large conductance mechanosensitive channel